MERQLLLLGVLRAQKMHGYQLNDFLERHYDFVTDLKPSTAYYLLDRLAAEGYVVMHQEQVGNRPQRRVYEITPQGDAYFFELLRQNLRSRDKPVYGDEIGLAFLNELDAEEASAYLAEKQSLLEHELGDLNRMAGAVEASANQDVLLTLGHHIALVEADLRWWQQLSERVNAARG